MYCLLFTFCFFMPVNTHKQTQEGSNQESMQSGNSMIKLENAGLRAPRKMSLGSGLHSQKRIRAPVSKMVGLRAPKQKFQGSRAPGTPPLGPCILTKTLTERKKCKNTFEEHLQENYVYILKSCLEKGQRFEENL